MDIAFIEIAQQQEIRIDTFDKKSNRTGYIVIDPRTGRFDSFDLHGNRVGHGTLSSPPSPDRSIDPYKNGKPDPDRNR